MEPTWVIMLITTVTSCLPRVLRRRLMVITNQDFSDYFCPGPGTSLAKRLSMAMAYYVGFPSLFCFTILPASGLAREGLLETGRMLDRHYSPITFPKGMYVWRDPDPERHDPGIARLAIETGLPILPVHLDGNSDIGFRWYRPRRTLTVHFGERIDTDPGMTPDEVIERVEASFRQLSR